MRKEVPPVSSDQYIKTPQSLKWGLISVQCLYSILILQHDNAPWHMSYPTMEALQQPTFGVLLRSPDLGYAIWKKKSAPLYIWYRIIGSSGQFLAYTIPQIL